jgi:hypothetical protein
VEETQRIDTQKFFNLICGDGLSEYIHLVAINPTTNNTRPLATLGKWSEINRFIKQYDKWNLYFTPSRFTKRSRKKEDALSCRVLRVDLDTKDFPGSSTEEKWAALKNNLAEFPLKPSVSVNTGNGIHAYWILKNPVGKDKLEWVERVNYGLAKALNGDHTHDISRLMRIPGTTNYPNKKKRALGLSIIRVSDAETTGLTYDESDLDPYQMAIVASPTKEEGAPLTEAEMTQEPAGLDRLLQSDVWFGDRWRGETFSEKGDTGEIDRSENDFALACALKDKGYSKVEVGQFLYHFEHGKGRERGLTYIQKTIENVWGGTVQAKGEPEKTKNAVTRAPRHVAKDGTLYELIFRKSDYEFVYLSCGKDFTYVKEIENNGVTILPPKNFSGSSSVVSVNTESAEYGSEDELHALVKSLISK